MGARRGRPRLSRGSTAGIGRDEAKKRRGRPPLDGAKVLKKGLDKSRKVARPATCHLCKLPIDYEDELVNCRVCAVLAHKDCEAMTGEDCGSF